MAKAGNGGALEGDLQSRFWAETASGFNEFETKKLEIASYEANESPADYIKEAVAYFERRMDEIDADTQMYAGAKSVLGGDPRNYNRIRVAFECERKLEILEDAYDDSEISNKMYARISNLGFNSNQMDVLFGLIDCGIQQRYLDIIADTKFDAMQMVLLGNAAATSMSFNTFRRIAHCDFSLSQMDALVRAAVSGLDIDGAFIKQQNLDEDAIWPDEKLGLDGGTVYDIFDCDGADRMNVAIESRGAFGEREPYYVHPVDNCMQPQKALFVHGDGTIGEGEYVYHTDANGILRINFTEDGLYCIEPVGDQKIAEIYVQVSVSDATSAIICDEANL